MTAFEVSQTTHLDRAVAERNPHRQHAVTAFTEIDQVVVSLRCGTDTDFSRTDVSNNLAPVEHHFVVEEPGEPFPNVRVRGQRRVSRARHDVAEKQLASQPTIDV